MSNCTIISTALKFFLRCVDALRRTLKCFVYAWNRK